MSLCSPDLGVCFKRIPSPKTMWGKQFWFWQRYRFKLFFHELAWKKCCLVLFDLSKDWFLKWQHNSVPFKLVLPNLFCVVLLWLFRPIMQKNRAKWMLFLIEAFFSDWHLSVSWFNLTGIVLFVFLWTWITCTTLGVSPCVACFFSFLRTHIFRGYVSFREGTKFQPFFCCFETCFPLAGRHKKHRGFEDFLTQETLKVRMFVDFWPTWCCCRYEATPN